MQIETTNRLEISRCVPWEWERERKEKQKVLLNKQVNKYKTKINKFQSHAKETILFVAKIEISPGGK
jgi:hypothetical protein